MIPILLLCVPLGMAGTVPSEGGQVVEVLERAAKRPEVDAERLRGELVALGPALAPELFRALAFGADGRGLLSRDQEEALLGALAHLGPLPLRPLLGRELSSEPATEVRLASLLLLARVGTSSDLGLLRRAVERAGPGLEDALRAACAGIAGRDPRILEALRRWMLEAPAEFAAAIARGLGDSECPDALGVLAAALGYRPALDPEILAGIGARAAGAAKPIDEPFLDLLVDALAADDPLTVRAAALALGHADAHGAVRELIPLLEHPARGVRAAALWALEHVSGLAFGTVPGRWADWLASEEAWRAGALERLPGELSSREPGVAIRALGELAGHRWQQHELALEAAVALEHDDPAVRRLACLALTRLGSTAALPALEVAREDEDPSVAEAARRAFESLAARGRSARVPRARASRSRRPRSKRQRR